MLIIHLKDDEYSNPDFKRGVLYRVKNTLCTDPFKDGQIVICLEDTNYAPMCRGIHIDTHKWVNHCMGSSQLEEV